MRDGDARADLTVVVLAPALNRAAGHRGARVRLAATNRDRATRESDYGDGAVAHVRRAVAEVAEGVVAPAEQSAVGVDRACVPVSRAERLDSRVERAGEHPQQRVAS